ncbi:hypothetical protein DL766_004843 [Monosporascus sp. MC13-8B]|uniref:Uncharacterized protein n=1 Tax=Monosporascus cannonballus TaxID=155416 RepID=A0ABY0H895_9PEZI|nr:hypothetical protein DL762_004223 [Monosporascus cannonballus]RYP00611.1 hypothetical protein DL763_000665 [Monosporascus cannonballus]RYP30500.1 hypothetical protein DL766_004843 [Monosporascus sp. MC13-8B]
MAKVDATVEPDVSEAKSTAFSGCRLRGDEDVCALANEEHDADEEIMAFVADPGFAATELCNRATNLLGFERTPVDTADACKGVVALIDGATKETHGGKFMGY